MSCKISPEIFCSSIKEYLLALQESGVDGVPLTGISSPDLPCFHVSGDGATAQRKILSDADIAEFMTLDDLRMIIGDCHRCKLGETRKNLVFGEGNPDSRLLFVGEGPGAEEDRKGVPFAGEAGRLLDRIIGAMGLQRKDVYICNVVKCRPPGNRNPEHDEISACLPFLEKQIESIKPEAIIALGAVATHALLGGRKPVSSIRGAFQDYRGTRVMPTYHPAFLKRREDEGDREVFWQVWDDVCQVLRYLELPVPERKRKK